MSFHVAFEWPHLSACTCMYCMFLCRSRGEIPACVEFDSSLLEDAEGLMPEDLQLNELTVEGIQHR